MTSDSIIPGIKFKKQYIIFMVTLARVDIIIHLVRYQRIKKNFNF